MRGPNIQWNIPNEFHLFQMSYNMIRLIWLNKFYTICSNSVVKCLITKHFYIFFYSIGMAKNRHIEFVFFLKRSIVCAICALEICDVNNKVPRRIQNWWISVLNNSVETHFYRIIFIIINLICESYSGCFWSLTFVMGPYRHIYSANADVYRTGKCVCCMKFEISNICFNFFDYIQFITMKNRLFLLHFEISTQQFAHRLIQLLYCSQIILHDRYMQPLLFIQYFLPPNWNFNKLKMNWCFFV